MLCVCEWQPRRDAGAMCVYGFCMGLFVIVLTARCRLFLFAIVDASLATNQCSSPPCALCQSCRVGMMSERSPIYASDHRAVVVDIALK